MTRLLAVFLFLLSGCAVTPPKPTPPQAVLPTPSVLKLIKLSPEKTPLFDDDADTATLRTAALHSAAYFKSRPPETLFTLATDTYTAADLAGSMTLFVDLLDQSKTRQEWLEAVQKNFQVYQSVGTDAHQTVTFSSYYEPTIPARLKRTAKFSSPIYGRPRNLVDVDLGQFDPIYQGARLSGRQEGHRLVPYYTRGEIDSRQALKKVGKVIAWARNPTDIFFMQIEGSGWLDLGGKKRLRIRYDGDNGRRYRSVGQYLLTSGHLPGKHLSHDEFEEYLNSNPKKRQSILNVNPRYVFFRLDRSSASAYAYGNIQVPLTAGRSIASDPKLFPKGLLAWIATDQAVFNEKGIVISTAPLRRYVLNQDEGGAIQGPGRVDFFAGEGQQAHQFATHFWQKGTLYFLVKRKGT